MGKLGKGRIEHILSIYVADPRGSHWPAEGNIRDAECRRRTDDGQDIGVVLLIRGKHSHHHLNIAAKILGEKWAQGPVGEPACQHCLLAGSPFPPEETTGDFPCGIKPLFVVYGKRQKVYPFPGFGADARGNQDYGLTVVDSDRTVSLLSKLSGFDAQGPSGNITLKIVCHLVLASFLLPYQAPLLLPKPEPYYQLPIAIHIVIAEILQEAAPLPHELQKTSPRMVVMSVRLEVFSQLIYPLSKQRNLDLG